MPFDQNSSEKNGGQPLSVEAVEFSLEGELDKVDKAKDKANLQSEDSDIKLTRRTRAHRKAPDETDGQSGDKREQPDEQPD